MSSGAETGSMPMRRMMNGMTKKNTAKVKAVTNPARQMVRYERPPNRIRELRTKAGLTQQQLADRSGINRVTIAKLEKQQYQVSGNTVRLLSQALGVEEDVLSGAKTVSSWIPITEKLPDRTDYYLCAVTIQMVRMKVRAYSVLWFDAKSKEWTETKPDGGLTGRIVEPSAWTPIPEDPW